MYAGAAAVTAAFLFLAGSLVRTEPSLDQPVVAAPGVAEPAIERDGDDAVQKGVPEDAASGAVTSELRRSQSLDVEGGGAGGSTGTQIAPEPPVPVRPGQFPPKIVRTANLEIEVDSFDRAWSRATALATRHGGFVTNSQTGLDRGTVTMRIPASKLDAALEDLGRIGKVVQSTTSAEDVSAAIVDIDARLRVLEAEELQLIELLRQATGVGQTLEVRDRLNSVRQEIESHKGQKEYFAEQVEYSTVNATLYESGAVDPNDPDDGILLEAWRTALRAGLTIVAGLLVVLGGLIPLTALALAIWFGVRTLRRRRA